MLSTWKADFSVWVRVSASRRMSDRYTEAMTDARPVIAQVLHRLYFAGAEVLAADLVRRLSNRYRFLFLCLDSIGPLGELLSGEGFKVADLGRRPGLDWPLAGRARKLLRRHEVSLLHAHQYTPFFYSAVGRGLGGPPIIFTEHGRHYPDCRKIRRVLANRFLLRPRDRVTAVGQFVKQTLVDNEGIPAKRIEVIYNGIDPAPFADANCEETRKSVRIELGIDPEQAVALQVARFHPVKDHALSLRAFANAARENPQAVLLLAGDGEEFQEAESTAAALGIDGRVRFLGVRTDVPRLMAAADLFVLSSLSEGVSLTLLEAMAAALPIIATEVGGNGEVVVHGETGLLSPRGDGDALAANLAFLFRDPRRRDAMGRAGRARLLTKFTQQRMHDQYAALYDQMVARR